MIEEQIIEILRREGKAILPETLTDEFDDKDAAASAIEVMLGDGRILLTRKRKLALPENMGLVYGRIQGNARGFGFFIPSDGSKDMFVPAESMHGAMHCDMVWARPTEQVSRNGAQEAEVSLITARAQKNIVGTYEEGETPALGGYVVPDDTKIAMDVMIPASGVDGAKHNDKVVVTVTQFPDGRRPLMGEITEVLGNMNDAGMDILSIIRRLNLPETFPKAALKQARTLNKPVSTDDAAKREDLRHLLTITIDGADAKDLDDAVSLVKLSNGYLLGVHIADVSHYVREGGPLDVEAYKRGTSVYFPDRVLPMLPEDISNGACSLNSGMDKLTLSCMIEFTKNGQVVSSRISESMINTRHRMTYDDVNAIFAGDAALREKYADILPMLDDMHALMDALNAQRVKRGTIDFDLADVKILLDANGKPSSVCEEERGIANRMIEEFMIAANEAVARFARDMSIPLMYRVHEKPTEEKLQSLAAFLKTLGYTVPSFDNIQPKVIQKILDNVKGTKEENVISQVALRSMRKARYAEECLGHFGLASECYCHFTSPIRRYPDLVVHRIMKELIHGTITKARIDKLLAYLPESANHCTEREIAATEAERAADDLKKCQFMRDKIGTVEKGIISGVIQYGFFVQLKNTVEGMVRVASIEGDYYYCDDKNYRFVGRNSGRVLRLGDEVTIKVARVDMEALTIGFELVDENERPAKQGAKKNGSSRGRRGRKPAADKAASTDAVKNTAEKAAEKPAKKPVQKKKQAENAEKAADASSSPAPAKRKRGGNRRKPKQTASAATPSSGEPNSGKPETPAE